MAHLRTAEQWRARAWEKLAAADTLLAAGQADEAAEQLSYAAEFALKGRMAAKYAWAGFPPTKAELAGLRIRLADPGLELKALKTHVLDDLLRFSGDVAIARSSFHDIDWARIARWSPNDRYTQRATVSPAEAAARRAATERLLLELDLFDAVDHAAAVERETSDWFGRYNLFAVCESAPGTRRWDVVVSAYPEESLPERVAAVRDRFVARIPGRTLGRMGRVVPLAPGHPLVRAFHQMARMMGAIEHHPSLRMRECIVAPYGYLPDCVVITNVPHQRPMGVRPLWLGSAERRPPARQANGVAVGHITRTTAGHVVRLRSS